MSCCIACVQNDGIYQQFACRTAPILHRKNKQQYETTTYYFMDRQGIYGSIGT